MGKPLYVAKKSGFGSMKPWCVWPFFACILLAALLGFVLDIFVCKVVFLIGAAVFALIQLCIIIHIKTFRLMVFKDRIVVKCGLIFVKEYAAGLFVGLVRVETYQGFWGHLLDFGTVSIQCIGRSDLRENGIFDPRALRTFLGEHFIDVANTQNLLINH